MNLRFLLLTAIGASFCAAASGQLPQTRLGTITPPGGQAGTTFDIRVSGEQDLEYETTPKLLFSHPGITAEPVADPATGLWQNNLFKVTIAPDVPAGRHDVVLAGYYGASNPRAFRVEKIPSITEATDASPASPAALPLNTALYGKIETAADVDVVSFSGQAGQTVVLRCHAWVIDSPLQPVLEVIGPDMRRIGFGGGAFVGDAELPLTLPASGEYRLQLHDAAYRGGPDFNYRVEIATRPVIAFVFPPAGPPGTSIDFSIFGYNVPGGEPVEGAAPLVRRTLTVALPPGDAAAPRLSTLNSAQADVDGFDFVFEEGGMAADPVPIFFSSTTPTTEQENDVSPGQSIAVPQDVAGRFETNNDVDYYSFDAKGGESYCIEVFAKRYGSEADPLITLDQLTGPDGMPKERRLSSVDDRATNLAPKVFDTLTDDVEFRFDVPEDGRYRIALRDRYAASRGDRSLFYLLSIRKPAPDFRLVAVPVWRDKADSPYQSSGFSIRKGESVTLPIYVFRRDGFSGPIAVSIENPQAGVTATPVTIAEGQTSVLLVATAATDAPTAVSPLRIVGRAELPETQSRPAGAALREARVGTIVRSGAGQVTTSRIASSLWVSILDESIPFRMADAGETIRVGQGSQLLVPLQLHRQDGYAEAVTVAATGLPQDAKVTVEAPPFAAGETQHVARLLIDPQAPARTYPLAFTGTAKIDYGRFPLRLKRAKQTQEVATQTFTLADEALKQFTAARDQAAKLLEATAAASQSFATIADATASVEAAKQSAAALEANVKGVEEVRKQKEAAKTAADAAAAEVEKVAAVQKLDYVTTAPPMSVTIVPAPVDVTLTVPNEGQIKRGEAVDIQVSAKRREGFTGPLNLSIALPPGAIGLTAEPLAMSPDQTEATLRVTATGDVAEGAIPFAAIRVVAEQNGPVQIDVPVTLKVVP